MIVSSLNLSYINPKPVLKEALLKDPQLIEIGKAAPVIRTT